VFPSCISDWNEIRYAGVHIMLLRICDLHVNQSREDCTNIMGLIVVALRVFLEIQERLVKSLYCVNGIQLAFMFSSPNNYTGR
jgi:hypothetical protein